MFGTLELRDSAVHGVQRTSSPFHCWPNLLRLPLLSASINEKDEYSNEAAALPRWTKRRCLHELSQANGVCMATRQCDDHIVMMAILLKCVSAPLFSLPSSEAVDYQATPRTAAKATTGLCKLSWGLFRTWGFTNSAPTNFEIFKVFKERSSFYNLA